MWKSVGLWGLRRCSAHTWVGRAQGQEDTGRVIRVPHQEPPGEVTMASSRWMPGSRPNCLLHA